MKALKSQLAKDVLASAHGRAMLRRFLASGASAATDNERRQPAVIEVTRRDGATVRVRPEFVGKAST